MIVPKYFTPASLLHHVMPGMRAPADQCFLVTPARQRKEPSLASQAAIADVVNEAGDFLQFGREHLGETEITVPMIGFRMDFEEH